MISLYKSDTMVHYQETWGMHKHNDSRDLSVFEWGQPLLWSKESEAYRGKSRHGRLTTLRHACCLSNLTIPIYRGMDPKVTCCRSDAGASMCGITQWYSLPISSASKDRFFNLPITTYNWPYFKPNFTAFDKSWFQSRPQDLQQRSIELVH